MLPEGRQHHHTRRSRKNDLYRVRAFFGAVFTKRAASNLRRSSSVATIGSSASNQSIANTKISAAFARHKSARLQGRTNQLACLLPLNLRSRRVEMNRVLVHVAMRLHQCVLIV
jgi:hypothetical protein